MYKVLIVDDEQLALEGLKLIVDWEKAGFIICGECTNGEEAAKKILELKPDLIVTDIRMPVMDGIELISYVKNVLGLEQKFIIISGFNEFEYARNALKLGVNHYLLKPFIEEEILEVLSEIKYQIEKQTQIDNINEEFSKEDVNTIIQSYLSEDFSEAAKAALRKHRDAFDYIKQWYYIIIDILSWEAPDTSKNANINTEFDLEILEDSIEALNSGIVVKIECTCNKYGLVAGFIESEGYQNGIGDYIHKLSNRLSCFEGLKFFIVIGEKAEELCQIKNSYNTAIQALNYSFFEQQNSIIYYSTVKNNVLARMSGNTEYPDEIIDAMEELDVGKLYNAIDKAFYYYEEIFLEPGMVKMTVINIIFKGINIIKNMGADPSELFDRYNLSIIEKKKLTSQELKQLLKNCCIDCMGYIKSTRQRNSNEVFFKIEEYIRLNYKKTITIKELGTKYYINPVYLGQLFIKKTGETFNEYVHRLRIQESMKLLKETDMKTNKIAQELGYSNYNSFLHYFEKYTSMKPSDYKNQQI